VATLTQLLHCCCSLGFNFHSAGGSLNAPPLPAAAHEDGWWNVDHERVKVSKQSLQGRKSHCAGLLLMITSRYHVQLFKRKPCYSDDHSIAHGRACQQHRWKWQELAANPSTMQPTPQSHSKLDNVEPPALHVARLAMARRPMRPPRTCWAAGGSSSCRGPRLTLPHPSSPAATCA
jgi:hypothetical protein